MNPILYQPDNHFRFMPSYYIANNGKIKKLKLKHSEKENFEKLFQVISPDADLTIGPADIKYEAILKRHTCIRILNFTSLKFSIGKKGQILINDLPLINYPNKHSFNISYQVHKFPQIIFLESIATNEEIPAERLFIVQKTNYYKCMPWLTLPNKRKKLLLQIPILIPNGYQNLTEGLINLLRKIPKEDLVAAMEPSLIQFKGRIDSPKFILLNFTTHQINIIRNKLCIKNVSFSKSIVWSNCEAVAYHKKNQPEFLQIHLKYILRTFTKKASYPLFKDPIKGYLSENAYKKLLKKRAFNLWRATFNRDSPFYRNKFPLDVYRIIILDIFRIFQSELNTLNRI